MSARKAFKVVSFGQRSLSWWRAQRNKIDMDPPYQRRSRLWSAADKGYLIDSILNGYDVPKIYIADFTWRDSRLNSNELPYAIIDGKQRFEAVFDFFDGTLVLNEDFVFLDDPSRRLAGLGYRDLQTNHRDVAEIFEIFELAVMSVIADSEEPINELFVRLNRSKSLTGAEVRNAMLGPAPQIIRELAKHDFFRTNVRFSIKRGADWNAAAKVLLFEYRKGVQETKKRNLDQFVKELAGKPKDSLELGARRSLEILDEMAEVFLPRDTLLGSAGVVPVYYWFIRGKRDAEVRLLREFLVDFERKKNENRSLVDASPTSKRIDGTLIEYDRYNRSTNDEQSHKQRARILDERFREWMHARKGGTKR